MTSRTLETSVTITLLLLFVLLLLGPYRGTAQNQSPVQLKLSERTGLPIIYPYHGLILNHDLTVIQPTPENALALFRAFSNALAERQPARFRAPFEALRSRASIAVEPTAQNAVAIEAAMVRWLITRISNEQKEVVNAQFRPVESWAGFGPGKQGARAKYQANSKLESALRTLDLLPPDVALVPPTYIEQCRAQSVPIPPDWGDAKWQLQGTLDSKYTFAGDPTNITQVWAYGDPSGTCMALPRRDKITNEIDLLGIICQSSTGAACFWDNIDRETGKRLTGAAGEKFRIDSIKDGANVAENCTNCHRGYNVFIIHPGTALDIEAKFAIDPVNRYVPLSGQATWGNPGPLINVGTKPCATCHEIPELGQDTNTDPTLQSAYCKILERVVNSTMPSLEAPAGWATPVPKFAPHVDLLREKCQLP